MSNLFTVLALGFFLGVRHATDPDHVVAVTTLVARYRQVRHAALVGLWWGVGHSLTILVVGSAIILFSVTVPPRLGLSLELSVAVMLMLLGVMNLVGFLRWRRVPATAAAAGHEGHPHVPAPVHSHAHQHGDYVHTHPHVHVPEQHPHANEQTPLGWLDRKLGRLQPYRAVRPLVVGMVHGLAGSAAVALMILATIADRAWSIFYLLVFGLGTILGMMLLTGAIALPFVYVGARHAQLHRRLGLASGLLSLVFGVLLAYRLGFVDGLFTGAPPAAPR